VLNKLAAVLDVDVVVLLTLEAQERSSEDTVSHISKLGA
jgi:hypothetical protein